MKHTILFVDDDPNVQDFSKTVLENAGFNVHVCGTAEAALKSFKAGRPDLVIMDIGLPDGNGVELCKAMGLGPKRNIPFLFLTARGDLNTRLDCFRNGAYDYIQKPFAVEELLARVNVHLSIKKLHDKLVQRNYELELRNRVRQDLTDMIAHDLRTPLTSIKGSIELIKMRGLISDGHYKTLLDQAETATDFMLLMLNDLLDIGQAEQVGLKPEPSVFDVELLLSRLKALFDPKCQRLGVPFGYTRAPGIKNLTMDHNLLFRILANLVSNAVKVSRQGKAVELDCLHRDRRVRFVVADRGPGVPASEKTRIFEKYTTLNRKSAPPEGGTGIGLTFCRLATTALNGKIWVEDRPGGGSLFILEAPG